MPSVQFIIAAVVIFIVLDVIILVLVFRKRGGKGKRRLLMEQLAGNLGIGLLGGEPVFPRIAFLSFLCKSFQAEGEFRSRFLKIYHFSTGSGDSRTTYATVRLIGPNPKALTFQFSREGFLSKIGKAVGMQDVQVGDSRFDKLFVVKLSDPDFISAALLPEIKDKFYRVWEEHGAKGSLKLEGEEMRYDEVGTIRNDAARLRCEAVANLLADLAEAVDVYG